MMSGAHHLFLLSMVLNTMSFSLITLLNILGFYPLHLKSNIMPTFLKFKANVEHYFDTKIVTLYFDLGKKYHKLTNSFHSMAYH